METQNDAGGEKPSHRASQPLVSVVVAVRNGGVLLSEAIESLLSQTLKEFEIIVVNDGSTDETEDVLQRYGSRIRVFHQRNVGLPKALNTGISKARGEFIARLDHDDLAEPERLERQVSFLLSNPKTGLLGSAYRLVDLEGNVLKTVRPPKEDREIRLAFAKYCPFAHSSVMFRSRLLETTGLYPEGNQFRHMSHDFDLWIRFAQHSELAILNEPLVRIRVVPGSLSDTYDLERLRNDSVLRAKAIREFRLPAWCWWYAARAWLGARVPARSRILMRRIMSDNPGAVRKNVVG